MRTVAAWAAVVVALLAGCSTSEKPKPTPLEPVTPRIQAVEAWRGRIDNVTFQLAVAVAGERLVL